MNQAIPSDEVVFHPLSFQDEAGRLFQWRGELYRGISARWADFFRRLFADGAGHALIAAGLLIPTDTTPHVLDGFDLVLHHQLLPFASYPFEWCPAMFKAACLTIIDMAIALSKYDLTLKDAHPWNVLFDGCRSVWIDVTSIIPAQSNPVWPAADEFYDECLHPLLLLGQGRDKLARAMIAANNVVERRDLELVGGSSSVVFDLITAGLGHFPPRFRRPVDKVLRRARSSLRLPVRLNSKRLPDIRRAVEKIKVPFEEPEALQNVGAPAESWNEKQRSVHRIMTETKPGTVLEIAFGDGWFSAMAASLGSKVVAFDTNPEAVGRLFAHACASSQSVLPLVMDFTRPTAGRGLANHSHLPATDRFRCDMVLLLGFLHDLVFRYRRLGLTEIVDGLALFSKRCAIVEFIPPDDPEVGSLWSDWFEPYSLDNLRKALGRHFPNIEVYPSDRPTRVLLFCQR
jgi:hypothetical protein